MVTVASVPSHPDCASARMLNTNPIGSMATASSALKARDSASARERTPKGPGTTETVWSVPRVLACASASAPQPKIAGVVATACVAGKAVDCVSARDSPRSWPGLEETASHAAKAQGFVYARLHPVPTCHRILELASNASGVSMTVPAASTWEISGSMATASDAARTSTCANARTTQGRTVGRAAAASYATAPPHSASARELVGDCPKIL